MTNGEKLKEIFPDGVLTSINNSYYWGDDILVSKNWWNAEYKEPTTKKDCNICTHNNETDGSNCYECVKDMCNNYEPITKNNIINDLDDFIEFGKKAFGVELTVKKSDNPDTYAKLFETTKNDLAVDCISRKAVQARLKEIINEMETIFADIREREVNDSVCGLCEYDCDHGLDGFANECPGFEKDDCFKLNEKYRAEWLDISYLPSVTPQEPQSFKWCTDCKEYDQEKHCCHRYSKVIRDTVEEIGQEPILDKIRAEIEQYQSDYDVHGTEYDRTAWRAFNRCLQIIDKYKGESEG